MIAAILALCFFSSPVLAQGFEGARTGFELSRYSESDGFFILSGDVSADASYYLGSDIGAQIGLGHRTDLSSNDPGADFQNVDNAALHLFYDLGGRLRVGVVTSWESYNGGDVAVAAEGTFVSGPLRLEGRAGRILSAAEPATLFEFHLAHAIGPRTRIRAFARVVDYGPVFGDYTIASLGLGRDVAPGVRVYADIGGHINNFGFGDVVRGTVIALGVVVALGGPHNDRMFAYTPFY